MKASVFSVLLAGSACAASSLFTASRQGPAALNLYRLRQAKQSQTVQKRAAADDEFPAQFFEQPLDHFAPAGVQSPTFQQRYWVSTRHYKPGGPVIVLDGGETSGTDRLPYLDTGILDILGNATGGLAIVLEHRYYGTSIPVANFSTDSLRWLNNEQALEDSANFMRNVQIAGINETITAPNRPWIYYGGSYAGARSAHMRVLYPDIVYGAIASSGVTHAAIHFWEYMDVIRNYTEPSCRNAIESTVAIVDALLTASEPTREWIKNFFGLKGLQSDQDFASLLTDPMNGWQDENWDPAVGSNAYDEFCAALTNDSSTDSSAAFNGLPGSLNDTLGQPDARKALSNYAEYIKETVVSTCPQGQSVQECFGTGNASSYQNITIEEDSWRLWQFQVCTQWGFFFTAPPPSHPTIVSRLLDLEYETLLCRLAYPPGEFFTVPALPNITAVNSLGGFAIAADRLAIVDGERDPWRPATAHSTMAKPRDDTTIRPFKLIPGAVHHWDENGLADHSQEPPYIQAIHSEEVAFVQAWLKDWKKPDAA